jgi:isoleucyl-tRNA synthetase
MIWKKLFVLVPSKSSKNFLDVEKSLIFTEKTSIILPFLQRKVRVLKRIPEVFDCWFESGSMPFAQLHYPFSISEEEFV